MEIGNVVYLKSGGRPMTVTAEGDPVECTWDGGSKLYPEAALTTTDPTPALDHAAAKERDRLKKTDA